MEEEKKLISPMIFDNKEVNSPQEQKLIRPMEFDVPTKSFEDKTFIILYKIISDGEEHEYENVYSVCIGRTETYNDIKEKLISGVPVDIHRSRITTETKQTETETGDRKYYLIPYEECISVYSFCTSVKEYYSDDPFDIEDYNDGEAPEDIKNDLELNPNYLTPEQQDYKKMLRASMERDKFLNTLRSEGGPMNSSNI